MLDNDQGQYGRPPRGRSSWTGTHRSEGSRSDAARSDAARSDAARSDAARSDAARSDAARSDAARVEVGRVDVGRAAAPRERPPPEPEEAQPTADELSAEQFRAARLQAERLRAEEHRANQHAWLDRDAGPVVRPYTLTGGRSRPITGGLSLLTHVEALYAPEADLVNLQPEHRVILSITRTALSIAEIAARLDLPVGVVRVLVGDLLQANLISTFESDTQIHPPDDSILQAVIDGLRAL